MDLITHIDTTIPAWSVLLGIGGAILHIINLTHKVNMLKESLDEIKEILKESHPYVIHKSDKKVG